LNAPPEEGIVYSEEAVREHARKIWFAVQSILGMNKQFQFKHVSFSLFSFPSPFFSRFSVFSDFDVRRRNKEGKERNTILTYTPPASPNPKLQRHHLPRHAKTMGICTLEFNKR
jgi:hypothetical protein